MNFLKTIFNPSFIVLLVYIAAFIRQYTWFADNLVIAWVFSFVISFYLTFLIIKKLNYSKLNLNFFLIVGVPLIFFYSLRFVFPDASFDIVNYHFINGERALRGYPFINGDFLYLSFANPISDMITGIFRHLLGHRVGTVINLLAIFWSAQILEKILSNFNLDRKIKYLILIILLLFEGITYQISNYWVELLSIPIVLELVNLLVFKKKKDYIEYTIISLFCGILISFKLINLIVVLPLSLLFLIQYIKDIDEKISKKYLKLFLLVLVFFAPIIPYHSYIFLITGNPFYPHLNFIFKSDLFHTINVLRQGLGPKDNVEAFFWPFIMLFKSERLSNTPVFPYLTFLAYIFSLLALGLYKYFRSIKFPSVNFFSIFYFFAIFIWGFLSGDFRYVYYFEVLGGLLILTIILCLILKNKKFFLKLNKMRFFNNLIIILIIPFFMFKFFTTLKMARWYEWAGRPSIFDGSKTYISNMKYLFKDYSLSSYLPKESREQMSKINAWISVSPVVSGYMVLLNNKIPYVDLHHLSFRGKKGQNLFNQTIIKNGPRIYSSLIEIDDILNWNFDESLKDLKNNNFKILSINKFNLPFFSDSIFYRKKFL